MLTSSRIMLRASTKAIGRCASVPRRACPLVSSPSPRSSQPIHTVNGARASGRVQASAVSEAPVQKDEVITGKPDCNVTESIFDRIGTDLHRKPDHPLGIIKGVIYDFFEQKHPGMFNTFDSLRPVVSAKANFDEVLVPADHVSRSYNDTYYVDSETVLRCHTSAHQAEMLRNGETRFLVTGDVYRRDTVDATHYPVFHQMEGVRVFTDEEIAAAGCSGAELAEKDLKETLEQLATHLFGECEMRWVDAYFPFTEPSFELEIFYQGEWLEVLGCGVMEQEILDKNGREGSKAWAFGLGLERLAMVLFKIPDIRLFWSSDERFLSQFKAGDMSTEFKPFSKYPPCFKDMAFWVSEDFTENNLCEIVRSVAGDIAEEVKLIDDFTNPKTGKRSNCYRIAYRSMERSLTDEEINALQEEVRSQTAAKLGVELR
ncbi:unnamed protein product [Pedinophyceae sp. YPF-701]|nr:unnamed protein product [Pedinophyceae sp. YPF-701]